MRETLKRTRMFRFDEMAIQVKDKIENPAEADGDRYVGLEHIDPESLKIRRWGATTDVESSKIVFKSGDIIFGKRRAYQRKLAVADFDGICSAHAMVLRPKTDVVLEEFLPFFMQSDTFMDRAVKISVGGLSPTINWRDLAKEEFALPPLEEQRRIAEVLEASKSSQECISQSLSSLEKLIQRFLTDTYSSLSANFELRALDLFGEATMGRQKSPKYCQGKSPFPYLRVANVGPMELRLEEIERMDFTEVELGKFRLVPGDILLTEGDLISEFNVGRPAIFNGEVQDCCFQNTLIRFRPNSETPPLFALALLEGARLNYVFAKAAKTTTVTHLGLGRFKEVLLPLPGMTTRNSLAKQLSDLLHARSSLRRRLNQAKDVTKTLLAKALL